MKALFLLPLIFLLGCANRPAASTQTTMTDYQTDSSGATTLFDFTADTPADSWKVEDDRVMGGVSQGRFEITEEGHGRFRGEVSLDNNGGFSSVQHQMRQSYTPGTDHTHFQARVKGDGKPYNFRVKPVGERYSFVYEFATSGEWEIVTIPFNEMKAQFRGNKVPVKNYAGGEIEMIRFLIGNKKEQTFELLIDNVRVR